MGPASTLGFARFSYSLLLPAMKKDLHWNYLYAGTLNTVNAVGYLLGALAVTSLASRFGTKRSFFSALLLVAVAGILTGTTGNFLILLLFRTLSGIGAAIAFVAGGSLISGVSSTLGAKVAATDLGIYYAGAGTGIVISGVTIPILLLHLGNEGWRQGWILLGIFSLICLAITVPYALKLPEPPMHARRSKLKRPMKGMGPSIAAYGIFGAGYVSFMTFLVAFMKIQGNSNTVVTLFWTVLGLGVMLSGPVWGRPLARLRAGFGLATVLGTATVGTLLPLLGDNIFVLMIAAFCFGVSLMATSTSVTIISQRNLDPRSVGSAIGVFTVAIAAGQVFGPIITGAMSDTAHGLRLGMLASFVMVIASSLVALGQRDLPKRDLSNSLQ